MMIYSYNSDVVSARYVYRTNRRAIAMMFVRPSVCLFVWNGRAL